MWLLILKGWLAAFIMPGEVEFLLRRDSDETLDEELRTIVRAKDLAGLEPRAFVGSERDMDGR